MGKGKTGSNPADRFRRLQRKKELEKNKKQRMEIRQTVLKFKDPEEVKEKLDKAKDAARRNPDDKTIPKRIEQLEAAYKRCLQLSQDREAAEKDRTESSTRLRGVAAMLVRADGDAEAEPDTAAAPLPAGLPPNMVALADGAAKAAQAAAPAPAKGPSVDDEYAKFMAEIASLK